MPILYVQIIILEPTVSDIGNLGFHDQPIWPMYEASLANAM